jgi:transposase-like protein
MNDPQEAPLHEPIECPECGSENYFVGKTKVYTMNFDKTKGTWIKVDRYICRNCFCKFE